MIDVMSDVLIGSDSRRKIISSVPSRTSTHQLARYALFLITHLPSIYNIQCCSNAVRRSKALVWHAAKKKKNVPKSEQYCMFFNRFGKLMIFML